MTRREDKDYLAELTVRVGRTVPGRIKRAAATQGHSVHDWMREVIYRALSNVEAGYRPSGLERVGGPGTTGDEHPYRGHGSGQYRRNAERESMNGDPDPDTLGNPDP